ncbi:MAG: hypothetical protein KJ066_10095 [Acidobacteria bacterium]|nr:hypothetical protein [Acidobacteriota bacterium]
MAGRHTSARRALEARSVGRRLACGYVAAGLTLLTVVAVRASALEPWFWQSLMLLLPLVMSFRSALVYAYRHTPSALNWWLRPAPIAEREFTATWLVYAILFGAASLVVVIL